MNQQREELLPSGRARKRHGHGCTTHPNRGKACWQTEEQHTEHFNKLNISSQPPVRAHSENIRAFCIVYIEEKKKKVYKDHKLVSWRLKYLLSRILNARVDK